ncbi:MAG: LPS export ABC transporter ATP-binding protein [Hydrogenobacter thermophilus]|uniref:LPS export ABC transporter ATP-binding protein n=1 Tax=Hydrogenobacter thermophilus TaxID=940 RepID=UPI001C79450A|nr:LPS export ABC transporter ATP-binding protein [Hydrogenobacter thermophilus]QWK19633.1 MAG: LPS export ABC transporter ATP-binding protein [Hydrogenobacter thermophilus]
MLMAHSVKKSYKGREVLRGINIKIDKGHIVGLLGPNGAGKTTLFNCLVGFTSVDEGSIFLDGKDITHMPAHKRAREGIAFLPQEHTLFEDLTVLENLLIFLEFFEESKSSRMARAEELLTDFGLYQVKDTKARYISGGQKRRLEIARSLIPRPKYILFDEPFAGIDPILVADIKLMIKNLKSQNIGVLITDHNVRETIKIVDRVYIISEGNVLAEGTPEEVIAKKEVREVYLGADFSL